MPTKSARKALIDSRYPLSRIAPHQDDEKQDEENKEMTKKSSPPGSEE